MKAKWTLGAAISLGLLLLVLIAVIVAPRARRYFIGFTCEELPSMSDAEAILLAQQDIVEQIEQVNPDFVGVGVFPKQDCPEKGYLNIAYVSVQDKTAIQEILRQTPAITGTHFFGIPYYLRNV